MLVKLPSQEMLITSMLVINLVSLVDKDWQRDYMWDGNYIKK